LVGALAHTVRLQTSSKLGNLAAGGRQGSYFFWGIMEIEGSDVLEGPMAPNVIYPGADRTLLKAS